jgi:hypothetical protein
MTAKNKVSTQSSSLLVVTRSDECGNAGEKAVFYFVNAVSALLPETQTATQPEVTLYECEYKCGFKSESYEETLQHEKEHTFLRNAIFFLGSNVKTEPREPEITLNACEIVPGTETADNAKVEIISRA